MNAEPTEFNHQYSWLVWGRLCLQLKWTIIYGQTLLFIFSNEWEKYSVIIAVIITADGDADAFYSLRQLIPDFKGTIHSRIGLSEEAIIFRRR